ncbi:serologically defined colon cancer antigen 8 isoform X2 [Rhinatrema bivittatum]|uniref:serologically defined colon cancer antigen 8 isoform X2 n=1 Tax=Rhinatrema bivittatum TaxID=194408 RepID=UPI00112B3E17|nr:serologically defined colon cancer antigen 8 isoform X2 [Rhinatrema bivittatum]
MSPSRTSEETDNSFRALKDLVPIIHDQSQYIHHLEAEVKFCKEELSSMKQRIRVVVLENEELHEVIKSRIVQETMREQTLLDSSGNAQISWLRADDSRTQQVNEQSSLQNTNFLVSGEGNFQSSQVIKQKLHDNKQQAIDSSVSNAALELEKWQQELERLKLLYQAKTETLESQVMSLRKELTESQKNCEDLKVRMKHQESLLDTSNTNHVGGLCLKCAQQEAVLAQTHANVHMQTIERLKKERDELMDALVTLRMNMKDMQQRESSAYEQVKHAVEMTEEANFEKTKALVQCEQLRNEIIRQKERLERELFAQHDKRAGEKEVIREEMKKEKKELSSKVISLSEDVARLEAQLERVVREKNCIANQLEGAQNQLCCQQTEVTKVCGEMRYQLNQTKMRKDETEKEYREYRSKTIRELENKDQEIEKLGLELSENKQRLEQAQQNAARTKDECLKLTELLGKSEHQLHLTRLEKDSIQHSLSNDVRVLAFQVQQQEQELTQKMQQMEAQHDKTVTELDSLLTSQNTFIAKLKEECQTVAKRLEQITDKNRSETDQLTRENEHFKTRLKNMTVKNNELEDQCIQHGRMHERMKRSYPPPSALIPDLLESEDLLPKLGFEYQNASQKMIRCTVSDSFLTVECFAFNHEII